MHYEGMAYTLFFNKNVVFPAQAEYSYSSADFRGDGSLSFEMSVIIQIIIVGHLCTVICFCHRPNYGAMISDKNI